MSERRVVGVVWALCAAALFAAGLALATSFFIAYPAAVLDLAWVVAIAAMVAVVVVSWRTSRNDGVSRPRAVGRSLRALGRFVVDFF